MNVSVWGKAMTAADAASRERQAILRKIRRMKKGYIVTRILKDADLPIVKTSLDLLEKWILDRDVRYNKRKGGMGR